MRQFLQILLVFCVLWAAGAQAQPARAQAPEALAVIDAVNALRASYGLAPYTVDPWLMEYAQQHSDYQASIGVSTHLHSDGSVSLDLGIYENVAGGTVGYITADFIVYQIWADPVHMKPMIGYDAGSVGVGYAIGGDLTYYTFNMRPAGAEILPPADAGEDTTLDSTSIPEQDLVTSTPLPDGAVYHVVGYGQTLWSIAIAYGVTVQQIRDLNNIPADSTDIYAGWKLLIKLPGTPYVTLTPIPSPTLPVTDTPLPTHTFTPQPSRTPTPTAALSLTPPAVEQAPASGTDWTGRLGVVLLVMAGFGLWMWVGQVRADRKRRTP